MNTKFLFAAALFAATTTSVFAQTGLEDDKTKTTVDGMKTKTKTAKDGKMKVKGKDEEGNEMKATTKPYKGKMAKRMNGEMSGDMKGHKGMKHHKGMKGDSTKMGGM
ncbi:hypothetical protein FNT36_20635 [Hymenobacter setariae]|uniref:Pentapeptide MXKDX repeat protein n=1 Tax=Hymenobacter setariae TaxID=2594794 RepID=A0A558BPY8_9BACT|nr:hypothetical protein [Hymenobacter setariae]TVT38590.1 hypothetical protein FNT36_20635 [Hymenobacter setariae]